MWGKNTKGCLGLGHFNDQYFPFKVSSIKLLQTKVFTVFYV